MFKLYYWEWEGLGSRNTAAERAGEHSKYVCFIGTKTECESYIKKHDHFRACWEILDKK